MLTGQDDRESDVQVMRAGAADYLVKGDVDALTLERAIRYSMDRSASMQALADSERQFRSLLESALDGILIVDHAGSVVSWNPSAVRLFGAPALAGRQLGELLGDPARPAADVLVTLVRPGVAEIIELEGSRDDGTKFPVEVALSSWESKEGQMWSAVIRDITERKALESQLEHQAFHDALTGLANRLLVRDRLDHALQRSGRSGAAVAALFLDLDDFKQVNDTLGHEAGDELLRQVGLRLVEQVRVGDTAARLGGDEFAIVVEDIDDEIAAIEIAERILEALVLPFAIGGTSVEISASIGIDVTARQADRTARRCCARRTWRCTPRRTRARTDSPSSNGRCTIDSSDASNSSGSSARQPSRSARGPLPADRRSRTGQISGVEALMRWLHPERGLMMPNDFVAVAEETGMIVSLGRILRVRAFEQTRRWIESGVGAKGFYLSVNVSPRELDDDRFVSGLLADLERAGLGPESLVVEVTEGMMMRSRVHGVRCLEALRANGIRSAIDDFGTGYSSLSYLQELPAEILKIDRSFVNRLQDSTHSDKGVVAAIIAMGENLGLTTVAEGVETNEQRALLSALGCELGQGYLFARPAAVAEMDSLLAADRITPVGARALEDVETPELRGARLARVWSVAGNGELSDQDAVAAAGAHARLRHTTVARIFYGALPWMPPGRC